MFRSNFFALRPWSKNTFHTSGNDDTTKTRLIDHKIPEAAQNRKGILKKRCYVDEMISGCIVEAHGLIKPLVTSFFARFRHYHSRFFRNPKVIA